MTILAALLVSGLGLINAARPARTWVSANNQSLPALAARLGEQITLHATGLANPRINLADGRELLTSYTGPDRLRQMLDQNQARPLALASADFDEDGTKDLISGYALSSSGVVTVHRGNVDSIYPDSPEARRRKAEGQFTNAPFLSPASLFELPGPADFLAAGDFDGDGHKDIVTATRGGDALILMSGDGKGGVGATRRIELNGSVTSLVSGEINRADGLADIVVGIAGQEGPAALIFEGAGGALRSRPERIALPADATSLALGQLDDDRLTDLAIAAGSELLVARGRARNLSAAQPSISNRLFASSIKSLVIGDFQADHRPDIAMLFADGKVQLLSQGRVKAKRKKKSKEIKSWKLETLGKDLWPQASALVRVRTSSLPGDDLLVLDPGNHQIHIATADSSARRQEPASVSLAVEGEPFAVLPMRLNRDALDDLAVLRRGQVAPTLSLTAPSQVFQVINTNDGGPGSLRQAILDANANPGMDTIEFFTMQSEPTIFLLSDLPAITDPVLIDATTEPAFSGTPIVEITPFSKVAVARGQGTGSAFTINSGGSALRGFVINNMSGNAITMITNDGNMVEGNFLGTDRTGTNAINNVGSNILTDNSSANFIGGPAAQARNLISASFADGITFSNPFSSGNFVQGNFIGTDINGLNPLRNDGSGIRIESGSGAATIGGQGPNEGNLISGNFGDGITITDAGSDVNIVQGNLIGTDASGNESLSNFNDGVGILNGAGDNQIGGSFPGAGNVISGNGFDKLPGTPGDGVEISGGSTRNFIQGNFIGTQAGGTGSLGNTGAGVRISNSPDNAIGEPPVPEPEAANAPEGIPEDPANLISNNPVGIVIEGSGATGNRMIRNLIFSNDGLGIDLGGDGVTANDPGDADTGPNNLQNFPVLTSAQSNGTTIAIQGTLESAPDTGFIIEFFSNSGCDPSGNGEGENFIGVITVTTDNTGIAQINGSFPITVPVGSFVTATATDPDDNTSEFSQCAEVTQQPCTITCPNDITVSNDPGQCSAAVNYPPPVADPSCGMVVCNPPSGGTFPVGTTTVTCTTDAGPSCSFLITVNDTEPPVITCPDDIVVESDPGQSGAIVNYPDPVVTDNCFIGQTVIAGNNHAQASPSGLPAITCVPPSGSNFPTGITTVTCTAVDGAGNSASCQFTITVQEGEGLSITCPENVLVPNSAGECSAVVNYPPPVVTGGGPAVCSPPSGSTFQAGTTTVTCTATDGEVTITCQFTVTVRDSEPPVVTCPGNIVTSTEPGEPDAVVNYPRGRVTDNCPGATVVCIPPSGTRFPLGVSTVTCTGRDLAGNTSICTFTVTVNDRQAPTITCPSNIIRDAVGQSSVIVDYPPPVVGDNLPNVSLVCNPPSGTAFPVGVTTVSCTATDEAGNQSTCTFTVTVLGAPSVRVVIPNGQTSVTFGRDNPVRPRRKLKKKKRECSFFSVENTGATPVVLTLESIMRTGSDVEDGTISRPGEGDLYTLSLINADGSETPLDSSTPVTVPSGGSVTFCVRFRPLFPPVADGTTNLSAEEVVPDLITSKITLRLNSGQLLVVPLRGIVRANVVFINTDNPRSLPVLSLARSGDQFILRYSLFDPNLNVSRAVYQFLDGAGRAVGGPIEVNLASALGQLNLVKGQSFTVEQRFTGANSHPEVQRVEVTVFDGEGSVTDASGAVGSAAASSAQSQRVQPVLTLHLPEKRLNGLPRR